MRPSPSPVISYYLFLDVKNDKHRSLALVETWLNNLKLQ